ncbi:SETMR methyltransferase, partial [Acromyrmex heyeri]
MEKNEFRAVIKHLHMKGLTPKEIKARLDNVHSTSASAFATVYNWMNEFKRDCTSTCDAPRSGCPIEDATPEIIDKVHDIVLTDRRVKLSARWMPHLLTVDHKRDRDDFKTSLEIFQCNPDEFLCRFITVDETWSKQWTSPSKKKRLHLTKKKVLFHQDNAWVHTCSTSMVKFNEFRYELLPHPAHWPDLAPCDYFLFPNLKKWFGVKKRFITRELIAETEAYFERLDSNSLKKLENRWIKCIELKGDYVENKNELIKKNMFYYVFLKTYCLALVPITQENMKVRILAACANINSEMKE